MTTKGIFIGYRDDEKVRIPQAIFARNGIVTGSPGSGKTNIIMHTILVQVIKQGERAILVLDPKPDIVTREVVAKYAGSRFEEVNFIPGTKTSTIDIMGELTDRRAMKVTPAAV